METIARNLEMLRSFHSVATHQSYTRAADKLGASKAMLSKQVKLLEHHLRAKLFHRTTRKISLTEQGMALLSYSQKIFDLSDEADKRIRDMHQGQSGVIRISAPPSFGDAFFNSFLPMVSQKLPKVKFEADLTTEVRHLIKDRVDFALRIAAHHHPDLVARHLGQLLDVICVAPTLFKSLKNISDPKKLIEQNCILNTHNNKWNTWTLRSGSKDINVEVSGQYATNQYFMMKSFCLMGFGVARLPYYLVTQEIRDGRLIRLFPEYQISTHSLYLVHLRSEYSTIKHKTTKEEILRWFADQREIFCKGI